MSFKSFVASVRAKSKSFGVRLSMSKLNDAISIACYDRPYSAACAAEAAGKLPGLTLPPPFIDAAAERYGVSSAGLRDAIAAGSAGVGQILPFDVFLSAYWKDQNGDSGRETLLIHVTRPLRELVSRRGGAGPYRLDFFRPDADDHLETRDDLISQDVARLVVAEAARALHFMDATNLRLAAKWSYRIPKLPRQDHTHHWLHAPTGTEVVADEPYCGSWLLDERRKWGEKLGVHFAATDVRLYGDGRSVREPMFFASLDPSALDAIISGIARRKSDLQPSREWTGESAAYAPSFSSPARQATGKRKRPRPSPIDFTTPKNNALPYVYSPMSSDICWRPANTMPRVAHEEIGRLANALIDIDGRSIGSPIGRVRTRLDSWLGCELDRADVLGSSDTDIYWRSDRPTLPNEMTPDGAIDRIVDLLRTHYLDSAPLRQLLKMLESERAQLSRLRQRSIRISSNRSQ